MIDIAFHPLFKLDMGPLHYFSVLGRALYTAQHLEMNCRAIVGIAALKEAIVHDGLSSINDVTFKKRMLKLWKKTLGHYITQLSQRKIFPENIFPVFESALHARNEIAHTIAMSVDEDLDSECLSRIESILILVRKIAEADKYASAMIHIVNHNPLPNLEYLEKYEDKIISWVAEETFEE